MNKRTSIHDILLVTALAMATGMAASGAAFAQDALYANPAKQFHAMGKLKAPSERTAYLPVTQVKWMLHGTGSASTGGGLGPGTKMIQEVNSSIDAARIGKIAQALHDDLVAQLESAGWNVQTRGELGEDVPKYRALAPDGELGVPRIKERSGEEYVLISPVGMPSVAHSGMALASASMAANSYARGKPGVSLFVTYGFSTAAIRETESRMLNMETKPVLTLFGSFAANTAASSTVVVSDGVVVANDIGTLSLTEETGVGAKVFRYMTGMRQIDKKVYALEPDWDKLETEAFRAGKAFNAQIVAQLR